MAWPPTTHQDVQDEVATLRARTAGAALTVDTTNDRVGLAGNTAPAVPVDVGIGDDVAFYTTIAAQVGRVRHGTAGSPNTIPGPTVRVSRTEQLTRAQIEVAGGTGTDGGEQCAAIIGLNSGTVSTEVQPVGVYGASKTASSTGGTNDACGIYGSGRVLSGGTGTGIGGFFIGRRETTGRTTGIEVHIRNGGSASPFIATGFSGSHGIWVNCSGTADSAAALTVSNAFGRQFDVGIGFTSQVTGGLTGGVKNASIRDESQSATSLLINGTHATAAIGIASGAGSVGIGVTSPVSLLHVSGGDVEITGSGKGAILPAPDGSRWRVTVDNAGRLSTAVVP